MNAQDRIKTLNDLLPIVEERRRAGEQIVTTNGCFDIIHAGHVATLEWARQQGDLLIVGLNSDASVTTNKGPGRPIIKEGHRAWVLAGLRSVDFVFIYDEFSPIAWMRLIRPGVHVKGGDSEKSPAFRPEREVIEQFGGEVRVAPAIPGLSTTKVIDAAINLSSKGV